MGLQRRFSQVDVFTAVPLRGNPLAVVHDASGLSDAEMAALASWTNLSETTFLLRPPIRRRTTSCASSRQSANCRSQGIPPWGAATRGLRRVARPGIHRPWYSSAASASCACGANRNALPLPRPRCCAAELSRPACAQQCATQLGIGDAAVRDMQWVENGPPWIGVLLQDAQAVLDLRPDFAALRGMAVGVVGPYPKGAACAFEVRAFTRSGVEDPVTGSLNAGLALWLIDAGIAPERYIASQGTVLKRNGRVHVERIGSDYLDRRRGLSRGERNDRGLKGREGMAG